MKLLFRVKKKYYTFVFRLELKGGRYKLSYEATPLPRNRTLQSAAQNDECFVFEGIDSDHPFPNDGKLTLNVKIEKC